MIISGNYKDCRVFIRYSDNDNEAIDATIVTHNKEYMTISVRGQFADLENNEFVTVLIPQIDSVHEYRGKLRRSLADPTSAEIALFKGQQKEERLAKRYTINAPAIVECLIIDNNKIPLPNAVEVIIINFSTAGVLITAPVNSFFLDSIVEIKLNTNTNITTMNGRVVRVRNIDADIVEYGCLLIAAY